MIVDTTGLKPAAVLAALYNGSKPLGMGFLQYQAEGMGEEEAEQLLTKVKYFDYLKGRVMKVGLENPNGFEAVLYDRDNGSGAAQRVIDSLRAGDSEAIAKQHKENTEKQIASTFNRLHEETRFTKEAGMVTAHLGLADAKEHLEPALKKAKDGLKQD